MSIGEKLYAYLCDDYGVDAYVDGRIEQNKKRSSHGVAPYLFSFADRSEKITASAAERTDARTLRQPFLIWSAFATKEDDGEAVDITPDLAIEVKNALMNRGGGVLDDSPTVRCVTVEDQSDDYIPHSADDDQGLAYRRL